jgi:YD repeat-containing protein
LGYDTVGNLTTVAQPGLAAATMTYDLGGRKVTMNDPDLGAWSYAYNRRGQLVRQTDARGWTTCLYYDALGRLTSQYFQTSSGCPARNGGVYRTTYTYDGSGGSSLGQLTSVAKYDSGGGVYYRRNQGYDGLGRLATEGVQAWNSGLQTTTYGYDAYGRAQTTGYPSGDVVTVTLGAWSQPVKLHSQVWGDLVDGAVKDGPVDDAAAYDVSGQLQQLRYPAGGNLWRTQVYHPWVSADGNGNRRLWYLLLGTGQGSGDRYQTYLGYDTYGNLQSRSEFVGAHRQENYSFQYDAWNRVSQGTYRRYDPGDVLAETIAERHTYDGLGSPDTFGSRDFDGLRGHFAGPAGAGYVFDGNGNVRQRPGQELVWDAENHLYQVNWGSPARTEWYNYDERGLRVRKAEGTPAQVTAIASIQP